jgi:hypothetical protein
MAKLPKGARDVISNETSRIELSAFIAMISNAVMAVYYCVLGTRGADAGWMIALAVYYGCLAVIRFLLLRNYLMAESYQQALSVSYVIRYLMLALNVTIDAICAMMISAAGGAGYRNPLIVITGLMALATVAITVRSYRHAIKNDDPLVLTARTVSLTTALVSLYMLVSTVAITYCPDRRSAQWVCGVAAVLLGAALLILDIHSLRDIRRRSAAYERQKRKDDA